MIGLRWNRPATHAVIVAAGLACLPLADVAIAASSMYDGVYRGERTITRGDSFCGQATLTQSFTVVNGQFSIVYTAAQHVGVNLEVQADGSFSGYQRYGTTGQLTATGHIAGNVLEADISGIACTRHYHLTKIS